MQSYLIAGIQQVGIGNVSVYKTWEFYRKHLGFDLPIFDEAAQAKLMLPYTKGEVVSRHAVLALNFQGGGGLEIWQYTSRQGQGPAFPLRYGDLGICSVKYKCLNVDKKYQQLSQAKVKILTQPSTFPFGINHFFAEDDWGNVFEVAESNDWYTDNLHLTGGVYGTSIGVTDLQKSADFYKELLGYDTVIKMDVSASTDLDGLSKETYERWLLKHSKPRKGPFSQLLGPSIIELVKAKSFSPEPIFKNRQWGDLGYIHLCFDVNGMDALKTKCESIGHPFTVDSANSFDMGEAAGRFAYVEDPDGTLIEFVETHKIPIMKKWNWYLDLRKRNPEKPLPRLLLKALSWSRVKKEVG